MMFANAFCAEWLLNDGKF